MDKIKDFLTPGTITAVLSVAAVLAGAFGYNTLQAFFADPSTVQTILTLIGAIGTLIAGLLDGIKKPQ